MSATQSPDLNQHHFKFNTRSLFLMTTWAALCYTAIFANQNLLSFQIARFIWVSMVMISTLIPFFLELEHRRFWNAYSIAIVTYLSYSFIHDFSNPVVSEVASLVCQSLRLDEHYYSVGIHGIDYANHQIGRFTAIYYFLEIHFVVLAGVLVGVLWECLKDQAPLWVVGAWGLFIAMDISGDELRLDFLSMLATVSILPACINYHGPHRPFWTSFGVFAFIVGIEAITSKSYDFTWYVNDVVAMVAPRVFSRVAESITFIGVPISAAIAGWIVQSVVQKQEFSALKKCG